MVWTTVPNWVFGINVEAVVAYPQDSDTLRRVDVPALTSRILQISRDCVYLPALLSLTKTTDYWEPLILVQTFSFQWDLADIACQMFSMVSVPIYDTHGAEGCLHIIVHGNPFYRLPVISARDNQASKIHEQASKIHKQARD